MTLTVHLLLWFLVFYPASAFAPLRIRPKLWDITTITTISALRVVPEIHRNVIVLSHNVSQDVADGLFDVNNLLSGRIDVLARCVNSAIWVSNGIRKDTSVFLMLFPHNITIEIQGRLVSGLNPDERTMALCLQRTLLVGNKKSAEENNDVVATVGVESRCEVELLRLRERQLGRPQTINLNKPGSLPKSEKAQLRTARKQREAMVRRINRSVGDKAPLGFSLYRDDTLEVRLEKIILETQQQQHDEGCRPTILMLNELGDPLWDVLKESATMNNSNNGKQQQLTTTTTTLILGDQIGYAASDEKLLAQHEAVREVSLGPLSLLTSQCITITHHYLDSH